ncbi:MAG: hypothetical protein A3H27_11485 [Acidobacteria bacterium RIFCSPLOWO2_02_FULL_59_13]|nr:MAG: hypothetical protein A3H27_11485 [Acidobacteria bacterium RIFCSPLOWO2_02_FULL_59_13]
MEENPQTFQIKALPVWKRLLLLSAGASAGFALTMAVIIGSFLWYYSRPKPPKPWNTKAIKATFSKITPKEYFDAECNERYDLVLDYILENVTDWDYSLADASDILWMRKLPTQDAMQPEYEYKSPFQIDIPARQRVLVRVQPPLTIDEAIRRMRSEPTCQAIARKSKIDISAGLIPGDFAGFVLFDKPNRYQINFPKGW